MDPENVRTIVTGFVALVPAGLLFLQNRQSTRLQSHALDEERKKRYTAADERRERELATEREAQRQRMLRLASTAERVSLAVTYRYDRGQTFVLSAEDRQELTEASQDVLMSCNTTVRDEAGKVTGALESILWQGARFGDDPNLNELQEALANYQAACRAALDVP